MLYNIVNISDPYTIEAQSLDVALVACLFLGGGQYAFEPLEKDSEKIPLFLFGGADEWCRLHLNQDNLKSVVDHVTADPAKRAELAECFESCLIGNREDRETYRTAASLIADQAKREEWRAHWSNVKRSSLNDIGGRAYRMAANLRSGAQNPLIPAPQQMFAS